MTVRILTPLALQNEDVLRALATGGHVSIKALAAALGRDDSNLGKSLRALHDAGLIYQPASWKGPTDEGRAVLSALDRAAGAAPAVAAGPAGGTIALLHGQIAPDPLNPRKHFDPEALGELAESIARDDLLENLVVREAIPGKPHRLVAGERRWRAIGLLLDQGRWPRNAPIDCKVVAIDDAAHRRIALVENLQRKDLRPIDEANALKELMDLEGLGTAEIAKDIGFTQRFVQQRLQLLDLPPELKARVNLGELSIERARDAAAMWPKLPPIKQVELREGKINVEACRKWLSDQPEPIEIDDDQLLILAEVAWAIAAKPASYWTTTICDYRVEGLPRQMETAGLLTFSKVYYGPGEGSTDVRLTQESFRQIRALCGADEQLNRTALEPLVRRARVKVIGGNPLRADYRADAHKDVDRLFKEKRYHTAWLNKPFAMDPKIKAEKERQKAEQAAQNKKFAEQEKAAKARREQAQADAAKTLEIVNQLAADLAGRTPTEAVEGLPSHFDAVRHPLPWRADERAAIVDAVGGLVFQGYWHEVDARQMAERRLVCAVINAAAGVAFQAPDAPPPALTREAYLTRIAAQLIEAEDDGCAHFPDMAVATEAAGLVLDAFLKRQDLTFGDPEEDWDLILDDVVEEAFQAAPPIAPENDLDLSPKPLELAAADPVGGS